MTSQSGGVNNGGMPDGCIRQADGTLVIDPKVYAQALEGTWHSIHAVLDGPDGWLGTEFTYRGPKNSPKG